MAKAELVRGKETHFMVNMRARTIGLAALLLLVLATFVMAQSGGTEATLVVSTGQAVVNQGQGTFFATSADTAVSAGEALTVHEGDTIQLAETAAAQLRLKDGSTIDLAGGTTLSISELVSNELSYRARFSLLTGRTLSQVVRLLRPNDSFEIKTPSSTASVRGTRFTVEVISSEETYFAVEEGVVQVTMADQAVDVTAGFEVTAVIGQPLHVVPGETNMTPPNNTPQPDPNPTAAAAEENTAVPATINSQPQNNTPAAPSSTPRPETTANASSTPKNSAVPSPTSNADEDEVVTNTPTAPMNTPPTTSGSTPSSTPVIAVTNTSAAPTALPTQVPTNTPAPVPTNTLAPLPTNTPAPAPTNTPAPPPTNTPDAEAQVTICHNGSTIEVAASAVDAHLAHGDTLGPCP